MTYPPGPPQGPGYGGDPHAHGQQPPENPTWWDQPATPPPAEYPAQQGWPGQPADQSGGWQQQQPGWDGQQGYGQQGGYQQPGYQQPGGGYPQPPKKSNTGLIVGIAAAVVVVLAAVVGAAVFVTREDSGDQAIATSTTTTTSTSSSAPTTTKSTTTTSRSAPAGAKFSYTEYGNFWNFKLGDVALQADWVKGNDYNDCGNFEEAGKMTGLGCQYGSELVWKAEGGELMLTQFVLTMSDAAKAEAASGQFDDGDLKLRPGSYISDFETGKWKDGSEKQFLVVTVATATTAVPVETVEKYLRYRHSDTLGALIFR
ncbi:hypothetical protein JK358_18845 [Nocardia sp. 2]|uniref:Uncharacterized protein n=1 Tax=Nocardia acididurans TaxID=2802282 RepID=A0ABS1M755_9NOCA|nr:hypothetical protein [Nocardia acididurans]MBL1076460.1 hypothetical protein [Nocardia acididurans]